MTVTIRPANPARPDFIAGVSGLDLCQPIGAAEAAATHGWPVPEARALLRDLTGHATQREFVHAHVWREGDLVIWDNRVTMHRARRYPGDKPRDLRRTTIADVAPTLEQAA